MVGGVAVALATTLAFSLAQAQNDRCAHIYIFNKRGTGKSTLLETLIRHDAVAGEGLALIRMVI